MEWSLSKHQQVGVDCIACHGASTGHILDERDKVKPDRIPRGEAIASLCLTCHETSHEANKQKTDCQSCHNPHALVNPKDDHAVQEGRLKELTAQWTAYQDAFAKGEQLLKAESWDKAADEFRIALKTEPGDHRAAAKLRVAERRMHPVLAGFEIVGNRFDPDTGLPMTVEVTGTDIEMVLIPGGSFEMGSERFASSLPIHTVHIQPFYLAKTELTRAQWKAISGEAMPPSKEEPGSDRMPMTRISWDDCQKLLNHLNTTVRGKNFRLPNEAEWEYAARAGSTYPPADPELARSAWFAETTAPATEPVRQHDSRSPGINPYAPRPVGAKRPNAWGLFDTLGNVWEWCSSANRPYPYDASDGREAADAPGLRILRGGGFSDSADYLDPALRHTERRDQRQNTDGMRLARSVPSE
jgi:formylglycine-generating enzyme required for sulfatase activity